ncbi:hypothetical protein AB0I84_08150 [Streptomyces spectabilis]|uniref:hypothetical protein n=1 Tax=Streptomyces spectabilis TaxID=68270 RepID=UPI0034092ACD
MQPDDVDHLDRLARRVDSPGPIAVVDPLSRNLLAAAQAAGLGDPGRWAVSGTDILLYGGGFGEYVPNSVSVEKVPDANGPDLFWQHPLWPGFPVVAGMAVTWWAPGLVAKGAALGQLRIEWYDAAGTRLSTGVTSTTDAPMVRTAPDGSAFMRPAVRFTAKGLWEMGPSVLAVGDSAAPLSAGERPVGDGCPPYSITRYTHAATAGNGAFRDITLELVEVTA